MLVWPKGVGGFGGSISLLFMIILMSRLLIGSNKKALIGCHRFSDAPRVPLASRNSHALFNRQVADRPDGTYNTGGSSTMGRNERAVGIGYSLLSCYIPVPRLCRFKLFGMSSAFLKRAHGLKKIQGPKSVPSPSPSPSLKSPVLSP